MLDAQQGHQLSVRFILLNYFKQDLLSCEIFIIGAEKYLCEQARKDLTF